MIRMLYISDKFQAKEKKNFKPNKTRKIVINFNRKRKKLSMNRLKNVNFNYKIINTQQYPIPIYNKNDLKIFF